MNALYLLDLVFELWRMGGECMITNGIQIYLEARLVKCLAQKHIDILPLMQCNWM